MRRTSSLINGETIVYGDGIVIVGRDSHKLVLGGGAVGCCILGSTYERAKLIIASESSFTYAFYELWGSSPTHMNEQNGASASYTYNGKTVYYAGYDVPFYSTYTALTPSNDYSASTYGKSTVVAWTMIYGEKIKEQKIRTQYIPVQWNSSYRSEPY